MTNATEVETKEMTMTTIEETAAGITKRPRERDGTRTLFAGKHRRPVLQIERDAQYPEMWRVRLLDGTLTDMTNISRAKEAARDIAAGIEAQKTPHKSPLKSLTNFSWSRPPVAPLQKSYPEPIEPAEIAPVAKSAVHEATEDSPLPTAPDAPPIAPRAPRVSTAPLPPRRKGEWFANSPDLWEAIQQAPPAREYLDLQDVTISPEWAAREAAADARSRDSWDTTPSDWQPSGDGVAPEIPDFLRRIG